MAIDEYIKPIYARERELRAMLADVEATRDAEWVKAGIASLQSQLEDACERAQSAESLNKRLKQESNGWESDHSHVAGLLEDCEKRNAELLATLEICKRYVPKYALALIAKATGVA